MILSTLLALLLTTAQAEIEPLPIQSAGVVSLANTSISTLAANAEFVGQPEETLKYSDIVIFVHSDVASATDGLKIEWSTDGSYFDDNDSFTYVSTGTKIFTFGAASRFFRVRYKNGTTPQGVFRLQT